MTSVETEAGATLLTYSELRPLFGGAHVVYGGCYPIREPNVSDDELRRTTQRKLRERGFPDPLPPIIVCVSPEERLDAMLPQGDPDRVFEHLPLTIVVEDGPQLWINAARRLLVRGAVGRGVLEQVTFLGFTSLRSPSDVVDRETGIRIVELPPGSPRFLTHPTPDS